MDITNELRMIGESAPPGTWDDVPPSDSTQSSLWDDVRKLRAFAQAVMGDWPDFNTLDGGEIQEIAVRHGLLMATSPTSPCGDGCQCVDYYDADDFEDGQVICYRKTPLLMGPNGEVRGASVTAQPACEASSGEAATSTVMLCGADLEK